MHDFATTDLNFDVKNDTGDAREDILSRDIIMVITMITMMMITMITMMMITMITINMKVLIKLRVIKIMGFKSLILNSYS